MSNFGVFV